jgi:hypothetical protein
MLIAIETTSRNPLAVNISVPLPFQGNQIDIIFAQPKVPRKSLPSAEGDACALDGTTIILLCQRASAQALAFEATPALDNPYRYR